MQHIVIIDSHIASHAHEVEKQAIPVYTQPLTRIRIRIKPIRIRVNALTRVRIRIS